MEFNFYLLLLILFDLLMAIIFIKCYNYCQGTFFNFFYSKILLQTNLNVTFCKNILIPCYSCMVLEQYTLIWAVLNAFQAWICLLSIKTCLSFHSFDIFKSQFLLSQTAQFDKTIVLPLFYFCNFWVFTICCFPTFQPML